MRALPQRAKSAWCRAGHPEHLADHLHGVVIGEVGDELAVSGGGEGVDELIDEGAHRRSCRAAARGVNDLLTRRRSRVWSAPLDGDHRRRKHVVQPPGGDALSL